MALDIVGKLLQKLDMQSGDGAFGSWRRQDAIIETIEQYPKKICISFWNEKISDLDKLNLGETLTASVNIESRENNGKWYTSVRVWRLQQPETNVNANQQPVATATTAPQNQSQNAAYEIPVQQNSDFIDVQPTEIDDLPF